MDEHPLTKAIAFALSHGAYEVRVERTLAAKLAVAQLRPHLAIVDVDADAGRTIELVDEQPGVRRLPIIALTHRNDLQKSLAILDRGADDILHIPLVPAELMTRVRVLIRRAYGERVQIVPVVQVGDLSIDTLNRRVQVGTLEIHLTSLEQALLYLLAANSGKVVTRDVILEALGGPITRRRPTSWNVTFTGFASRCARTSTSRVTSTPCRARATASSRRPTDVASRRELKAMRDGGRGRSFSRRRRGSILSAHAHARDIR